MKRLKRIKILLALFLITTAGAVHVLLNDASEKNTYGKEQTVVGVEAVSSLRSVSFGKNIVAVDNGVWKINGKYEISDQLQQLMVLGLGKMEVKRPLSQESRKKVYDYIRKEGIKVSLTGAEKKSFFIITNENDPNSSYYLEENSHDPLVVYVPGFTGDISNLFKLEEADWRSKKIFEATPRGLQSIKVSYPASPENSFEIFYKENIFHVRDLASADTSKLIGYLQQYGYVSVQKFIPDKKDSLSVSIDFNKPYAIIEMVDIDEKKSNIINIYKDPANAKVLYGILKKGEELVLLRADIFTALLVKKSYFNAPSSPQR